MNIKQHVAHMAIIGRVIKGITIGIEAGRVHDAVRVTKIVETIRVRVKTYIGIQKER